MSLTVVAQKTGIYTNEYSVYDEAAELYDKEKYTAAQELYSTFIEQTNNELDDRVMHAYYYKAMCSKELYHADAEFQFIDFLNRYPESPRVQSVYFNMGIIYYRKKNWVEAVKWFEKVDKFQLSKEELAEYYFKKGYSHFQEKEYVEASKDFREIKDVESQYQNPAIYYYSHIAYEEKNYQTALEGFNKLKNKKGFSKIVPYYITQIYYKQGKYDEVIAYGAPLLDSITPQKKVEIANMVGDSYYKKKKYDEAIPYLEIQYDEGKTTLEEHYRLAYAYYMVEDYNRAIKFFASVSRIHDELGQNAMYYMGDSYEKLDKKSYAQNAYKEASELDFDKDIQEDALFKFAQLAYELSLNPYDEAIEAFQKYLATYPDSPRAEDAYQYLINVYMTTKNYKAALESLEKVDKSDLRLQRAYQMIVYNRAVELYSNNQYDEAVTHFKKVKQYPLDKQLNSLAWYWIAEVEFYRGRYPQAKVYYNKFIKEPGSYDTEYFGVAHYNIAYTYLKDQDFESALEEFRQYIARPDKDEVRVNDAYLRIADAYFMKNSNLDDKEALKYYQRSIDMNLAFQDYAHFKKGITYGYLGEPDKKIKELKNILSYYSSSIHLIEAKYEIGEAYRVQNDYPNAIEYYLKVSEQHSNNILAKPALLNLGHLFTETNQLNKAIDSYMEVLESNPNPSQCKDAVFGLKDVYVKRDQLDRWENVVKQYNCIGGTQATYDSTYFVESVNRYYLEGNCEKILVNADKYLEKYPNGFYKSHALSYKADCLYESDKKDEALVYYERLLEMPQSEFTETALMRTAEAYYKLDRIQEAFVNFNNLEKIASQPENLLFSKIGQMRCFYKLGSYGDARDYAVEVYKTDQTPENIKVQAQLILGMSYMHLGENAKAKDELEAVNKKTTSVWGAEAKYHVALIYFKEEDYPEVEKQVLQLIKQKPSYDYWVAKGYILLADNLAATGDYFNAKATLNSVIDNYVGDDDIVETAQRKLEEIIESEKEEESGKESRSMEIDLGGDEDVIKDKKNKPKDNNIEEGGQDE